MRRLPTTWYKPCCHGVPAGSSAKPEVPIIKGEGKSFISPVLLIITSRGFFQAFQASAARLSSTAAPRGAYQITYGSLHRAAKTHLSETPSPTRDQGRE